MITLAETKIRVKCPESNGYYLRWYFNGWHYHFFKAGSEQFNTSGEWHNTDSISKVQIGDALLSENQIKTIRTMLFALKAQVLLSDGWKDVIIDGTTLKTFNSSENAYSCEFNIAIYSKVSDYTPVVLPEFVDYDVRATPEDYTRVTPEDYTRIVSSSSYDPIVSYVPFATINAKVGDVVSLPNQASVTYLSGKTEQLNITWDKQPNTSVAGTFTIYGDVGSGALVVAQSIVVTELTDLEILKAIRAANPTSQLPSLWLDSEDPYTQWEGVQWDAGQQYVLGLDVSVRSVKELSGVNRLNKIQTLNCSENQITSLELSNLQFLQSIICNRNQIITLNITNLPVLAILNCSRNSLQSIPTLTAKGSIGTYDFRFNNMQPAETTRFEALGFDPVYLLPQTLL